MQIVVHVPVDQASEYLARVARQVAEGCISGHVAPGHYWYLDR